MDRQALVCNHPVVDRRARLDAAARANVEERPRRHASAQVGKRDDLAVDERDRAALAHEGAFTIGVVHQHPVDDVREELAPLRGLNRVFQVEGSEIWLRRARRPVARIASQRVIVKALQKLTVGLADRRAIEDSFVIHCVVLVLAIAPGN